MVQSLSYLAANTKLGTGDDSVSLVASGNSFVISDGSQSSTIAAGTDLGSGGATVYANSQAFPLTGLSAGDFAFASNNNTLYMTNGSGWYKIALVNQDPSISLSATSVTTEPGSNTANVTYTITEPEGTPTTITISYDFTANANIVHDSSNTSLSITNTDSNTYTGTVTVTVSDGVNTGVGTISLTNSVITVIDNSNYTTLLVKAEGNGGTNTSITDSSTNAHTVTVYGNTQATSFSPYRASGYSAYIDGSGSDWLKTDTHADFTFGTGDFTVECWYYPVSKAQNYPRILHFGTYWLNNQAWGILDRHDSYSTKISVQAYSGAVLESSTTVTDGEWYHIALERSGTTITLYINGTAEDTYDISTNNFPDASTESYLNIGNVSNGPNLSEAEANGYVKDVRIVKGSAVYQGNFTPPTSTLTAVTNTVFLGLTKPYFTDASGQGHTLTPNGSITHKPFAPYDHDGYSKSSNGGSIYFDGTGDYLTYTSAGVDISGDFTFETWMYAEDASANFKILDQRISGISGTSQNRILFDWNVSGFRLYINGSAIFQSTTSSSVILNKWCHIALNRSSGTVKLYLNGLQIETASNSTDLSISNGNTLAIGTNSNNLGSNLFEGYLSDYKFVAGTAVYGDGSLTVPTSPLSSTSAALHVKGTDASIYDAAAAGALIIGNNTTSSTTSRKFSTSSSVVFDGTGDFINIDNHSDLFQFGSNDFTVEGWYKADTTSGDHYIISFSGGTFSAGTGSHFGINIYQGNWRAGGFDDKLVGGVGSGVNTGIDTTTWHHFALVHASQNLKYYIDGTQIGSTVSTTGDTFNCGSNACIGGYHSSNTSYNWDGYLQDIRVTKGLARYTSNFTPPTAELEG